MHKFSSYNGKPVWIDLGSVVAIAAMEDKSKGSFVSVNGGPTVWVDEQPEEVAILVEETLGDGCFDDCP